MLVLTRKMDESIVIGEDIKIIVKRISPSQVRIAIEAPPDVRVLRSEVAAEECELVLAGATAE